MHTACARCRRIRPDDGHIYCPDCRAPKRSHWSPNRDRAAQRRFRNQVLARDGYRCRNCGNTQNLRACHLTPISQGGTYDPTNGVTRCANCDRATDPHAR